jgi:hypothetical protein
MSQAAAVRQHLGSVAMPYRAATAESAIGSAGAVTDGRSDVATAFEDMSAATAATRTRDKRMDEPSSSQAVSQSVRQ